jgi:hypothetical protein
VTQVTPGRVDIIKGKIQQHRPRAVVFYGLKFLPFWSQIASAPLEKDCPVTKNGTVYMAIAHPAAHNRGDYFRDRGEQLRRASRRKA